MNKRNTRIDTNAEATPLMHNPFAALSGDGLPTANPPQRAHAEILPDAPGPSFAIHKTKKGGYPIFVEKRGGNKKVTLIRNLTGDLKGLLTALKKHCSAGGVLREDAIELQGDHRSRVEDFLKQRQ
jgi:translation initiation factor 1 (eIF-1/SUI1)